MVLFRCMGDTEDWIGVSLERVYTLVSDGDSRKFSFILVHDKDLKSILGCTSYSPS